VRLGAKTNVTLLVALAAAGVALYEAAQHFRVRRHLALANASLERREFREAGAHLDLCLSIWPNDPEVRLLAAQAARRGGDFAAAHAHLRAHQQLQGEPLPRMLEQQLLIISEGELQEADRLLEPCLHDVPTPHAYLILDAVLPRKVELLERTYLAGMTLVEGPPGRDRARTEQALALWLREFPCQADQVQGLVWLGRVHMLTNIETAAADFRRALVLAPDHFDARLHLASALVEYDAKEAVEHLRVLRQRDPSHAQAALLLATVLRNLGELAEARAVLDNFLTTDPDHAAALLERGKLALDLSEAAAAEPDLRRATALLPEEPYAHLALSRCLQLTGHETEANTHQKRYLELEAEKTRQRQALEEKQRSWRQQREGRP
jgi:tetratricopeptide (TPR) repeat protein